VASHSCCQLTRLHLSLSRTLCHPEFSPPNADVATLLATPNCCSYRNAPDGICVNGRWGV